MRSLTTLVTLLAALSLLAGCKTAEPVSDELAAVETPATTPEGPDTSADGPQAQKAFAAMDEMKKAVGGKLQAAIKEGGPASAISVCTTEGPAAGRAVADKHGLVMGRMSHKLRNPDNAPPEWAKAWMAENGGKPVADVQPTTVDLGDGKLGVIKPIGTMSVCTKCHGDSATIAEDVKAEIAKAYPDDQATGFSEGQVRGAFWAEVPPAP